MFRKILQPSVDAEDKATALIQGTGSVVRNHKTGAATINSGGLCSLSLSCISWSRQFPLSSSFTRAFLSFFVPKDTIFNN